MWLCSPRAYPRSLNSYILSARGRRWTPRVRNEVMVIKQLTAIIEREGDDYAALCPELDIASQGTSVSEARDNLKEAVEMFYEAASADEIQRRLYSEIYVTQVEVAIG